MIPFFINRIYKTMTSLSILFLLLAATTAVAFPNNVIRMLKPHSDSDSNLDCLSWRLGVETNNVRDWILPASCGDYVGRYMLGKQYDKDCNIVAKEAYEYAKTINVAKDGKDTWIFDVDETALSNLPFFSQESAAFGAVPNATAFYSWIMEGAAPEIPASLWLYKRLLKLGFKIVFLTGSDESMLEPRIKNLKAVGYSTWEKLIVRYDGEGGTAVEYKSNRRDKLVADGYRIRGNVGDQWSDLVGSNIGDRTFKMPNPMYYAP
ncbi:acid phosphatase 1-like [Rutidosis leptorrhynchoides]|uniref:acid phosphatase 1-like n=1 Tax=Rutidosis leptorrhynchoides TaxID=125765 RepID=UPI003A9A2E82